jgi:hypothetical protein
MLNRQMPLTHRGGTQLTSLPNVLCLSASIDRFLRSIHSPSRKVVVAEAATPKSLRQKTASNAASQHNHPTISLICHQIRGRQTNSTNPQIETHSKCQCN